MSDVHDMQRLVQDVTRRRGAPIGVHVGDLAWWSREPEARTRMWRDGDRVVAWAWNDECVVDPDHPDLYANVLEFAEDAMWASDLDDAKVAALEAGGFARRDQPFFVHLSLALDETAAPELPAGYRLAQAADIRARVAAQRAAFAGSTTTLEKYERLRATWPYREDLDVVVEHAEGYAAFALAWLDDVNGLVALEPVGTDPSHGRRGLARAAILEALRRAKLAGAHTVTVSARGDDAYPAPLRLYRSIGFEPYGEHHEYRHAL